MQKTQVDIKMLFERIGSDYEQYLLWKEATKR